MGHNAKRERERETKKKYKPVISGDSSVKNQDE
jgi:hypothetical protein